MCENATTCENAIITTRINEQFSKLYHINDNGDPVPFVCVICDRFLKRSEVNVVTVKLLEKHCMLLHVEPDDDQTSSDDEIQLPHVLFEEYTVKPSKLTVDNRWLYSMLLSPCGTVLNKKDGWKQDGYASCSSCRHALERDYMPRFAIANGYWFGATPDCLLALSRIELALLSPVKSFGYCFMYTGGAQMKGSLSYFKVAHESIARSLTTMEVLGLNNDIVVILYGYMTPDQKSKAMKTNRVNMTNLLTALHWLLENNIKWKERRIDINRIQQELQNPMIIDTSKVLNEDAVNNNVELTESFEVFFPDGTLSSLTGGQKTMEEYRDMIRAQKESGFDIALRCDLSKEIVKDYKDDNLVNACLLQFPYGFGGMNKKRLKGHGTRTNFVHVEDYVFHLSKLSLPQFHDDLFCLILYNMQMKQHMVTTAAWRVRHGLTAHVMSSELCQAHIDEFIATRTSQNNKPLCKTHAGRKYMSTIDAIAQSIPHTNQAAKTALSKGEAMQFYYGQPSYFLTVTPDDNNSFLVQVFNWKKIDGADVSGMTNATLKDLASKRETLRITYPGICAFVFEMLLEVVYTSVIGWDMKENCPTEASGLFGEVSAVSCTIEEQGRGTLHAHFLIWSDAFKQLRQSIYLGSRSERANAEDAIVQIVDNLTSTTLIGTSTETDLRQLPHPCEHQDRKHRPRPRICQDAILRFLRHKDGYTKHKKNFMYCEECGWQWSNTDVIYSYLTNMKRIHNLENYPDESSRLKAMVMEYQKGDKPIEKSVVRAAYDTHIHTKSCFKINMKREGGNRKRTIDEMECRFRYPRREKRRTTITDLCQRQVQWYSWNGSFHLRHLKEINVKRAATDAFQNESCTAIINSKLACNTNVTVLMPGPIAFYIFKYNLKGTQEEDQQQYERIADATRKVLSKASEMKSANSIAVSRLLAGSYAHQKTNIIKGCLSSFLTRNHSRFIFSHDFVWCPIHDIFSALNDGMASTTIIQHGKHSFFNCYALHYICRPMELEHVNAYDFYSNYRIVKRTANTGNELLEFQNGQFQHPSYSAKSLKCLQVVQERQKPVLVRFSQYLFPDTAEFNGNIFHSQTPITEVTETYCRNALLLFHPIRSVQDLMLNGTFTEKFRHLAANNGISEAAQDILQNIQDVRANAARITNNEDDLRRVTSPFNRSLANSDNNEITAEDLELAIIDNQNLEDLVALLNQDESIGDETTTSMLLPHEFSVNDIRDRGRFECGYNLISPMLTASLPIEDQTEFVQHCTDYSQTSTDSERQPLSNEIKRQTVTQRDIVKILLERTSRRVRVVSHPLSNQATTETLLANGSAESIFDWAKTANIDSYQRRAFEIFTASFVLTFFEEAVINNRTRCTRYSNEKKKLELIIKKTSRQSKQLICLLHGPAGCGKTTVIDLLIEYAREYCTYLPNITYSTNTVVVTAMSGVAATLLMGETAHSAFHLNRKTEIDHEAVEKWTDTRLVIIDEISFASVNDLKKIYSNLCYLKQNQNPFGGVHMIFSGDFRQLEPIGRAQTTIFSCHNSELENWINCYIELNGNHRFAADPEWGQILQRFRDGQVTLADIDKINTRQVTPRMAVPDNIRYATFQNTDRDAINSALFATRCQQHCNSQHQARNSILIFCDNIQIKNAQNVYVPLKNYNYFWGKCSSADIVSNNGFDSGKGEPVLQLYQSCNIMLPHNINVSSGQANGTQAVVKKINLKPHVQLTMVAIDKRHKVPSVLASQVESIELEHCNKRVHPTTFLVQSIQYRRTVKIAKPRAFIGKNNEREKVQMKFTQFPILLNNATTGHKLQGTSLDELFVHEWKYSVKNWIYVVLSRVRTLRGLYLRSPLSREVSKYCMPTKLAEFIERLKKHAPQLWTESQYEDLLNYSYTRH